MRNFILFASYFDKIMIGPWCKEYFIFSIIMSFLSMTVSENLCYNFIYIAEFF